MPEHTSVDELFLKFTDGQWNAMSQAERLKTLQQMENLIAREQGRPPCPVKVIPEAEMRSKPQMSGYFNGKTINLKPSYFQRVERVIPGINTGLGMDALNTLLHEGRHAWQRFVADGGANVDPRLRTLLRMNQISYCSPGMSQLIYCCQPVELDARRFAKERFAVMARRAIDAGCNDLCIRKQLQDDITAEMHQAVTVANNLSVAELRDYEEQARQAFREVFPDEDLDGVSMFDEVIRMIGSVHDYMRYVDGKPLRWEEQTLERVAAVRCAPDGVDAVTDPMLRGLLERLKPGRGGDGSPDGRIDAGRLGLR